MNEPHFYFVAATQLYPRLILGSDRFLNIFPKPRPPFMLEKEYIYKVMESAFNCGVGGYDLNTMSENVLLAFQTLKSKYNNVIGIGDPNWRCGYKLNNVHLMDLKPKIINTIVQKIFSDEEKVLVEILPPKCRDFFFKLSPDDGILTDNEISSIYIDEELWLSRLRRLSGIADFCLFGADYADWMIQFERTDLLKWQIETIIKNNMIPVSVCHWSSISLPVLNALSVPVHWTLANLEAMYLSKEEAIGVVKNSPNPITAFRILRKVLLPQEIYKPIKWLIEEVGVKSLVIGVDDAMQAEETFAIAAKYINSIGG